MLLKARVEAAGVQGSPGFRAYGFGFAIWGLGFEGLLEGSWDLVSKVKSRL